ncbi:MAG TPA: DHH family phosphoesterase [Patescibacteria group bacterium]|nr:DHH family phosphoesterase [Patescibacteria group bacterium]
MGYLHTQVMKRLQLARHPLLIADYRIDGDCLGSSLALADYLKQIGSRPCVFVSGPIPEKYRFLPLSETCVFDPDILTDSTIDLAVALDCSDASYVQSVLRSVPQRPFLINIDHHATNPLYGDLNMVDPEAPGVCEIVHQLFTDARILPSPEVATCLFCGIAFDTTAFFNEMTNHRAFLAASELIRRGARVRDIIRMLFCHRSLEALKVWGLALERLRQHPTLGIVSTCLCRRELEEYGVVDDDVDGLSNFLNMVLGVDTLVVLRETAEGGVKASLRTRTHDVASLARSVGGGGHVRAAGFSLPRSRLVCPENGLWRIEAADKATSLEVSSPCYTEGNSLKS